MSKPLNLRSVIALLGASLFMLWPAFGQQPVSPVDLVEMPRVSNPDMSPDGQSLVYRKSEVNWSKNKSVQRLRILDLTTGEDSPLFLPEKATSSQPSAYWSPDGSMLAMLMERGDDENDQIYLYRPETSALDRLTDYPADIEEIEWAHDSKSLYVLADVADEESAPEHHVIEAYENPSKREILRISIEDGNVASVHLRADGYIRTFDLNVDGAGLVYHMAPDQIPLDVHQGEVWSLQFDAEAPVQLTENAFRESYPQLSPDNRQFAYIATVDAHDREYYEDNLFVQDIESGPRRLLLPDMAMEMIDFAWDGGGSGLFILGNTGLRQHLYRFDLGSSELTQLTFGDSVVSSWHYDRQAKQHIYILSSAASPGDVYALSDAPGDKPRPLKSVGSDWASEFALPVQKAVTWTGPKRTEIEGLLAYPLGYQDGDPAFPLVTITHGGPRSSSQFGSWSRSRYVAVLAGQGYGVLLPNHRGGTGYGDKFVRDMVGGYFTNAHKDVLTGIEALVERGLADDERLIAMGWSAGGHMTNKLITYTNRFKAASSGAGASDWVSMYAESDVRHYRLPWFGKAPWERGANWKLYRNQSPLRDAWRVTTPTLFFSGKNDVRVPPTQPIMMYRAIQAAGAKTELYVADGEPHNYRKPYNQLFKINRELAWYAEHALGQGYRFVLPDVSDASESEDVTVSGPELSDQGR